MNLRTLARRSLRHYFRAHLGVLAGATLAAAVLIGALAVGDSVKGSLKERALQRLANKVVAVIDGKDRFFTQNLINGIAPDLTSPGQRQAWQAGDIVWWRSPGNSLAANALLLSGTIVRQDGQSRANRITVIGVNPGEMIGSWAKSNPEPFLDFENNKVWLNEALAQQLRVNVGDAVVVRIHKPSALSQDAVISPRDEISVALRLTVGGVVPAEYGGNLSLLANQTQTLNAFVSLTNLTARADLTGRANLLLIQTPRTVLDASSLRFKAHQWVQQKGLFSLARFLRPGAPEPTSSQTIGLLDARLAGAWTISDAELEVKSSQAIPSVSGGEQASPFAELTTRRIFLEPAVVRAALTKPETGSRKSEMATNSPTSDVALPTSDLPATPILTYLVNSLSHGNSLTPYSMVTAAGAPYTPADLKDDEIVVNQWLADDLGVKPGDSVTMAYYRVDAGTQLAEHTNTFRVHSIVPLAGLHADRTLMPEFPGLAKAESTRDWDAGFDLVHTIRDQDEAYWKQHRGTPKAFITLAAGQKLWANRFGDLTAIRWFASRTNDAAGQQAGKPAGESENLRPAGPLAFSPASPAELRDAITARIRANLNPADVGLVWRPVREEALKAATAGQDFGGLFIGFSFFLIVAALLLTAMLFSFSLEQRATEAGILLALGWEPKRVRRVLFREGFTLAALGTLLGAIVGVYYAKGVLWGLTTIWRDAVAGAGLEFHLTATTLMTGIGLSLAVAAGTMFLALRKQAKRPARELLNEGANESALNVAEGGSPRAKWIALGLVLAGGGLAAAAGASGKAELFFGAGALLLIGGLLWVRAWIRSLTPARSSLGNAVPSQPLERPKHSPSPGGEGRGEGGPTPSLGQAQGSHSDARPHPNPLPQERGLTSPASGSHQPRGTSSLRQLALRALARRPSRSLGTVALLASAAFLIIAVGANKLDATRDATKRSSGTGGFALWGESSLPVIQDLNTRKGRDFYGLDEDAVRGTAYVQFRVRDGDDASCLNLNRAQRPRLLGVKPEQLAERGAFTFTKLEKGLNVTNGWLALNSELRTPNSDLREVPAIGDANSIQWALGKKLGDTLDYVDERGQPFKVRLVGAVANSVLQGNLIIAESEFVRLFPSESGYRAFLIDVAAEVTKPSSTTNPPPHVGGYEAVSAALSRALQDVGLELTPTAQRLAQFNAVQNTYLNTFQILGGLGLLLGSVGLGVVGLRNVHERRGELGLMLALGFEGGALKWLVLTEHTALLLLGLAVGVLAALVAVLPALLSPGSEVPWGSLTITLGLVLANGLIWTVWATARSLRGKLVDALRDL